MEFSDIKIIAAGGESENTEFKTTTGQRHDAARTLSAMLNGHGGSVIFGVCSDGKVVGQQVADSTLEKVTAACGETIYPRFPPSIKRIEIPGTGGRQVLVASVPSGNMKPYTYRGRYFLRSGASTVEMPPETQLQMVMETAHTFDRWETRTSRRDLNAIDGGAVRAFCDDVTSAGRGRFESSAAVPEILGALNLLDGSGLPNRGAIALFGRPESFGSEYPVLGCHLAAVDGVDLGEDLRDVRIVEDNVFVSLTRAVDFCRDHLHRPLHINGLQARRRVEIPVEVLREALANAFAHRNYAVAGRVQVRIYSDRLEVVSPGGLPFGLNPADLYVPHGSRPWNPNIMACMFRRGVVEQLGSGTLRMIRLCAEAGLGKPVFSTSGSEVICSVPRYGYWLAPDGTGVGLSTSQATILRILGERPAQRGELADLLDLDTTAIRDMLTQLRGDGLVHVRGHGRGAYWFPGTPPLIGPH